VFATSGSLDQRSPTDCAVVCDLETSRMRRTWHALGRSAIGKRKSQIFRDSIQVAMWSKAYVCGRSLAGIRGSNPASV
jgi:hypothetical protein